jgi:hypothetical protein
MVRFFVRMPAFSTHIPVFRLVLPTETSLENTTSTHVEQGEVGFTSVQLGGYNVASQGMSMFDPNRSHTG